MSQNKTGINLEAEERAMASRIGRALGNQPLPELLPTSEMSDGDVKDFCQLVDNIFENKAH